ncbi:MAG TPA: large conductance mechanosensitive channel protein MscL, partial [Pirellulales bacterium]
RAMIEPTTGQFPQVATPIFSNHKGLKAMSIGSKLESFDPTKRIGGLFEEFKNFAFKGNMIDLAIGVIIGAAFGALIKSMVDNLLMPLVSVVLPGEKGYQSWEAHLNGVTIPFGKFLGETVNFLIVAFAVFMFLKKFMGWIMHSKDEPPAVAPSPPTKDQELLVEIRDLLKQRAA